MTDSSNEARYSAMVEFLGTFPSLSSHPSDLTDLNDGVALFEALGEIAPSHFDPTTVARHLGENWALKSSNLRKLVRNLEHYYHDVLEKTADFASVSVTDISRNSNRESIAVLFELVAAAAVTCENRAEFVGRIMTMTVDGQMEMKGIIEASMERVEDYAAAAGGASRGGGGDDDDDDDEKELVFDDSAEGLVGEGGGEDSLWGGGGLVPDATMDELLETMRERDELRHQLDDSRTELAKYRSELSSGTEEVESDNRRLRELTSDLQERLGRAQTSLTSSEEESTRAKRQLEEATAAAEELREKNALMADELDVANARANQLRKAEATAVAYRKKLESVGVMSQQMQELEDQSAGYLRQIIDLETANKQIPTLQRRVESMQEKIVKLELQANEGAEALKGKEAEVSQLKGDVAAAEAAKRMYEDELADLRAHHENGDVGGLGDDDIMSNLSLTSSKSVRESREKLIRLEHENETLKKQLADKSSGGGAGVSAAIGSGGGTAKIVELERQNKEKAEQIAKISADKAKLEAYTKRTLAKFQQKYMVALQECKAKLKEKHDRIEQLEAEKDSEKNAHKKEAGLLTSTVYELGMTIMQNQLQQR